MKVKSLVVLAAIVGSLLAFSGDGEAASRRAMQRRAARTRHLCLPGQSCYQAVPTLAPRPQEANTKEGMTPADRLPDTDHPVARINIHWSWEARDAQGRLKWTEEYDNIVVNTGLNDILDKYLKGSAYTAAHYVGLASSSPTVAAGDTMSSHAGWTEVTTYSQSVRQTATWGTVASQSVDNSASKATFSINGTVTVGGAFLTTNNTKSGTTGTLVSVGAFSGGNKALANGDTLNVTVTITAADDGV